MVDVEVATFEWVNWWNESRLHQSLDYRTPAEVEAEFWEHHPGREILEIKANT
ncbi:integrase core domain-containing protein [Corynebacterium diphtheriae]|uniref:integrase core domain-containing protein n=1 Tax=Corynebacterium diphtheriae TaxID=1717 RepID=UPI003CC7CF67